MRLLVLLAVLSVLALPSSTGMQSDIDVVASRLQFPTNLAFAPDGRMFFTEKDTGRVRIIENGRLVRRPFVTVPSRTISLETGLLGLALHPQFEEEPWVYLYFSGEERNRIVRLRAEGNRGTDMETIAELLPVTNFHLGGDMAVGPDQKLYVVIGEAREPGLAQQRTSVGGKVLRLELDGSIPSDNPFGGENPVYSIGHRNSFGICFDPETGMLWETENGPTGDDEVNRIEPGGNYGWPEVLGPGGEPDFTDPVLHFEQTIVPTGCAFYTAPHLGPRREGQLFFGDYAGTLHLATLTPDREGVEDHRRFRRGLPGITDVEMGPDGRLYVVTEGSILRLPRRVPEPEPTPTTPTPSPEEPSPSPSPRAQEEQEDGGGALPWALLAAGLFVVAAAVLVALFRRL